nr:hypothetical protein GCM10025732_38830 [Glycomyces mayteni]
MGLLLVEAPGLADAVVGGFEEGVDDDADDQDGDDPGEDAGASLNSRAPCMRAPMEPCPATMTRSSPAMRERHANAQPCFRPDTNEGSVAGMMTCRYSWKPFMPRTAPTRFQAGGT